MRINCACGVLFSYSDDVANSKIRPPAFSKETPEKVIQLKMADVDTDNDINPSEESEGFIAELVSELSSPLHLFLICLIAFLFYKILKSRQPVPTYAPPEPQLPRLRKDFTVQDLKKYDGTQEDGRVLVAVNGNVFDVTKGKRFYGPGGPYAAFGGKDASRGLATFSVSASNEEYDDLSDLNTMEMDSVKEWEAQFKEKYEWVGRLLKPGEQPTNYSDEEDEGNTTAEKSKDE